MNQPDQSLKTPLFDFHQDHGAKMVPFAGYQMPVNYPQGIIKEHLHTRSQAGLFDVSHMGQIRVDGEDIAKKLETLIPVDLMGLQSGRQKYGLLLNEDGGILDDLMVMHWGEYFTLVVNAACKHQDLDYLNKNLGERLSFQLMDNRSLIALQGPIAVDVLSEAGGIVGQMKFMDVAELTLFGISCSASRSGYTGEDGFEISIDNDDVATLASKLVAHPGVMPVGLGARDSLRLEAGLCLYGQDLDPTTSPIEANLLWAISPARRPGGEREGHFPGSNTVLDHIINGPARKLVGLLPEGRAPMRAGTHLFDQEKNPLGQITSGGFSPSLNHPISMGYISSELSDPETRLLAEVRGKHLPLTITRLPFVLHQYVR